jgi:hypothetical protein
MRQSYPGLARLCMTLPTIATRPNALAVSRGFRFDRETQEALERLEQDYSDVAEEIRHPELF